MCAGQGVQGKPPVALAVSRAIGDRDFKNPLRLVEAIPTLWMKSIEPGDFFCVGCDGIWDVIGDTSAMEILYEHLVKEEKVRHLLSTTEGVKAATSSLVKTAFGGGSQDNITAIVVAVGPPPAALQAEEEKAKQEAEEREKEKVDSEPPAEAEAAESDSPA
eukprot:Trichotokara_eunicae@DN8616_c0_g1_i1.p1